MAQISNDSQLSFSSRVFTFLLNKSVGSFFHTGGQTPFSACVGEGKQATSLASFLEPVDLDQGFC